MSRSIGYMHSGGTSRAVRGRGGGGGGVRCEGDVGVYSNGHTSVAGYPGLLRSHSSRGSTRSLPVVSML